MKPFLMILVVTLSLSSTLSANEVILDLGKVKVVTVMYVRDGKFNVTLSRTPTSDSKTKPLFFNNEPTLSFEFHPDKLDGISVIATPNQVITRRDETLRGSAFINLLLSKMVSGEYLALSCAFKKKKSSSATKLKEYVLSYFQVNRSDK